MPAEIQALLRLQVPLIVRVAQREMTLGEVTALTPGSMIEFPKPADEDLEILVNDTRIGRGVAVKVGENFGVRVTAVGDVRHCLEAVGTAEAGGASA